METTDQTKRELIISATEANLKALVLAIPIILLYGSPFFIIWSDRIKSGAFWEILDPSIFFLISLVAGIALHEFIHGIFWSLYTKEGFKSIKFGIMWKSLTPYCHCKEPMKIKHYITGAIMPGILLGLIPAIIALFTGDPLLLIYAVIFTIGAGGDLLIIWMLRKEDKNTFAQDHPSKIGCIIYD
jgi:hypothetical protein